LSTVQGLALVHLSVTALLLVVFVLVALCQRVARALERTPAPSPYPSDAEAAPLALPAPATSGGAGPGASVLDWTVDLREPHSAGARLQTS
jgi:hypothetical protein